MNGIDYITRKAVECSQEGVPSESLTHLYFQCALITGDRTYEQWDHLVVEAMTAGATVAEALEYGEE